MDGAGPRILVLCRGPVGTHMSAPGIRAAAMAYVLATQVPGARVTLAGPNVDYTMPGDPPFEVCRWRLSNLFQLVARHDIIVSGGLPPHLAVFFPTKRFVIDLFSQYAMEWMEVGRQEYTGFKREAWVQRTRAILALQLTLADFVTCNNERQRDSYVGMMMSLGLVPPQAYDAAPTLQRLIASAPHGLRTEAPVEGERILRGVREGFGEKDRIIVWNGGIIQWYDPLTLIEALRRLGRDDVKLLFLGASYPAAHSLGKGIRFQDAKAAAAANGQLNRTIFFEEGWVPYGEAARYLLEADIGVCTYFDNMETRYAHRTRFVDLIWAELPLICTHGDILAAEVDERGWGVVVPQEDPAAVEDAIVKLLDDEAFNAQCRRNLAAAREELQWENTLRPLINFCSDPRPPLSSKWLRMPGLVARLGAYMLRRSLYSYTSPRSFP